MPTDTLPPLEECTCLAVRQAARHVTQFYDRHLAPVGLRTTQFSILARLRRHGAMTINALPPARWFPWRMADAAQTLGIQRPNLYRKARQLGIPLTRVTAQRFHERHP